MRRTLRLGKDARRKVHSPPASDRSGRSASRAAAAAAGAAAATTSSAAATSASEQQGWAAAAAAAASWRSMAAWATDGSHTCPASAFCTRSHGAGRDASQPHGDASAVASLCPASGTPRGIPTARASIPSYAPSSHSAAAGVAGAGLSSSSSAAAGVAGAGLCSRGA